MNLVRIHKQKEQVIALYVRGVGICVGDYIGDRYEAVAYLQEAQDIARTLDIEDHPISTQHKLVRQILDFLNLIDVSPLDNYDDTVAEIYHLAREYQNGNP